MGRLPCESVEKERFGDRGGPIFLGGGNGLNSAKRNGSQVIENKRFHEIVDSVIVTISMA